jgi:hypothetical protein
MKLKLTRDNWIAIVSVALMALTFIINMNTRPGSPFVNAQTAGLHGDEFIKMKGDIFCIGVSITYVLAFIIIRLQSRTLLQQLIVEFIIIVLLIEVRDELQFRAYSPTPAEILVGIVTFLITIMRIVQFRKFLLKDVNAPRDRAFTAEKP